MQTESREFSMVRIIDAPRELVFNAWVDPKLMSAWWGPAGFTTPVCELDARSGGALRIDMQAPDGSINKVTGVFHEIIPGERIVFTNKAFEDAQGNPQMEALNMITFSDHEGRTKITVEVSFRKIADEIWDASRDNMHLGWNSSFDRLENLVKGLPVE